MMSEARAAAHAWRVRTPAGLDHGPGSVVEGQTASGYTVSLSQPAATDVTIKLTYSGTATDGSDYTAVTSVTHSCRVRVRSTST